MFAPIHQTMAMTHSAPKRPVDRSTSGSPKRCALYTRKSSSEGLDQTFNSLDAQREACRNYVASQAGEGWVSLEAHYDDGGFSGGSLDRPAIRRLMVDVAAGMIDVVVVYKIDRLSRSLIDFATLIGLFESHGTAFVAVTQAFNTTSSMGRLTLNVLLSFAQFERELTGERLRDKFAASRERGMWLSGPRPYGYRVDKGSLSVDDAEAKVIREVFARYPEVGSARIIANSLTARGILNKFGSPFRKRTIATLLQNRLYRGELPHAGGSVPGVHEPIVTEAVWQRAQEALAESGRRRHALRRAPVPGLLKGIIFDPDGRAIIHCFVNRHAKTYRYYVRNIVGRYGSGTTASWRFRAEELERAVVVAVEGLVPPTSRRWSTTDAAGVARSLIARIDIGPDDMLLHLTTGASLRAALAGRIGSASA